MKPIDPSYVPPETTFDQFPDGKYRVKGFSWFTLDDKERPILVAQKDGKLVGRLRFNLITGEDGPPMSCTLADMNLLAKAFGVTKLPNVPDESYAAMVTKYMVDLKNLCADKELEVEVSKGWVSNVPGMDVGEGLFYFTVNDVSSPEHDGQGQPIPKQGQYGSFFFVSFQVEAGEGGKDTPYKGATFTELVNYSLKYENGELDFEKNKDGSYTASAVRLSKLMRLAAPDPFAGEFVPSNPNNLLPYMRQKFLESKRVLKGMRVKEEKGTRVRLNWPTLEEATGYTIEPKRLIESMGIDDKCREVLVEALDKLAGSPTVVKDSFELNEVGRKIAKQYLSPLKKEGIIAHGSIEELTPEEITSILTTLQNDVGPDYKERVVALAVGFEPPKVYEEEDSPF